MTVIGVVKGDARMFDYSSYVATRGRCTGASVCISARE